MPNVRRLSFFFLVPACLGLSRCGVPTYQNNYDSWNYEPNSSSLVDRREIPLPPERSILEVTAEVRCANSKNCPPAVGLLLSVGHDGGECTTSLIRNDLLLTNRHCVGGAAAKLGALPANKYVVIFPANPERKLQEERREIVEVLDLADYNSESFQSNLDFAILKLKEPITTRSPLRPSGKGVSDEKAVQIFRVSPFASDRVGGTVSVLKCQPVYKTLLAPRYTHPHYQVSVLTPCDVVPGNSGAAMVSLDNEEEVIGLIRAGQAEGAFTKGVLARFQIDKIGEGVPLSCMKSPYLGTFRSDCEAYDEEKSQAAFNQLVDDVLEEERRRSIEQVQSSYLGSLLAWTALEQKSPQESYQNDSWTKSSDENPIHFFLPAPRCVKSRQEIKHALGAKVFKASPQNLSVELSLRKFRLGLEPNLKFRIDLAAEPRRETYLYQFDFAKLDLVGSASVNILRPIRGWFDDIQYCP